MTCGCETDQKVQKGFTLLEMMLATVILLVGLVGVAQLVPVVLFMNSQNRSNSSELVIVQRELDEMLEQPLTQLSFIDADNNVCSLGDPTQPGQPIGSRLAVGAAAIDFTQPAMPGYSLTAIDPTNGATYDVRWTVITLGNAGRPSMKRFIIGARAISGSYFPPITLDTIVSK